MKTNYNYITRKCPICEGKKGRYWALNILTNETVEVTETTYRLLPSTEEDALKRKGHYIRWEFEKCERCSGDGVVEFWIQELIDADREVY